jgi:hypothetical protein
MPACLCSLAGCPLVLARTDTQMQFSKHAHTEYTDTQTHRHTGTQTHTYACTHTRLLTCRYRPSLSVEFVSSELAFDSTAACVTFLVDQNATLTADRRVITFK